MVKERQADRPFKIGLQVVATPFSTGFDHLRLADEAQFRFNIAMRALRNEAGRLPIYGVGHSLGSLLHLLISARYDRLID